MPVLFIPWFKLEAWEIPLPGDIPVVGDTLPIQPFGLLVAFGVLLGAKVAEIFAKRKGLAPSWVADLVAHCVISGFLFGYLLNAAFYEPEKLAEMFDGSCRYFGLSSFGGFIGAIIGLITWRLRRGQPALPYADAVIFALPFGWLFGRTGCFVVHDHPGRVTDFFLAVDSYEFGATPFEPRHDLGFYEVLWSLVAIAILVVVARKDRPRGFYCGLVPLMYTPFRFYLDFLRASPEEGGDARYFGLTPAHYASILVFLIGVAVMVRVLRGPPVQVPPEGAWPPRLDDELRTAPLPGGGSSRPADDEAPAARPAGATGSRKGSKARKKKRRMAEKETGTSAAATEASESEETAPDAGPPSEPASPPDADGEDSGDPGAGDAGPRGSSD